MIAAHRSAQLLLLLFCLTNAQGGNRSSGSYSIPSEINDLAGGRATSANYTNIASVGPFGGITSVSSPAETNKSGYVGQLYDIIALSVTAPPSSNLNETGNRQLVAAPLADDNTTLAALNPSTVSWSIVNGPIASISSSGLATAGNVYQDTTATVAGAANSLSGQLSLTILNVNNDDFGSYANDGIDDAWQVQYFGQPPNPLAGPNADADGTGQTNLFKFIAGLNPLNGSRFLLNIQPVPGQASQKNLIFSPLVAGRTYTAQSAPSLVTPSWSVLPQSTQNDNGTVRTVTDLSASPAPKFYRVQISKP